jgi:hypothetical protein
MLYKLDRFATYSHLSGFCLSSFCRLLPPKSIYDEGQLSLAFAASGIAPRIVFDSRPEIISCTAKGGSALPSIELYVDVGGRESELLAFFYKTSPCC